MKYRLLCVMSLLATYSFVTGSTVRPLCGNYGIGCSSDTLWKSVCCCLMVKQEKPAPSLAHLVFGTPPSATSMYEQPVSPDKFSLAKNLSPVKGSPADGLPSSNLTSPTKRSPVGGLPPLSPVSPTKRSPVDGLPPLSPVSSTSSKTSDIQENLCDLVQETIDLD